MERQAEEQDRVRQELLRMYDILDTPREKAFDDLAIFAAEICNVPLAFISFIDGNRQWFKAGTGNDAKEAPLDTSFCRYTLEQEGVFMVPDAINDIRFASVQNTKGVPAIRFYAGIRLVGPENVPLGTLGLMDLRPRALEPHQIRALECLADQVMAHLELRRTVRELSKEREDRNRFLEFAGVHRWRLDFATMHVTAGPALYEIFGLEPNNSRGIPLKSFIEAVHEDDRDALQQSNARSMLTGQGDGVEFRLTGKDGITRWYQGRSMAECDGAGNPIGQLGLTVDITSLKSAQLAREESQNRLQKVLDQLPAAVSYWDKDLVVRFSNEQFAESLGLKASETLGRRRSELVPAELAAANQSYIDAVLQGRAQSFDRISPDKDGRMQFFRYTLIPDFDGADLSGYFVLGVEHTDTWRSRVAAEEQQTFLRPVLDAMPVCVAYWDSNLNNRFSNHAFLNFFGKERSDVEGKSIDQVLSPDLFEKNLPQISAALNGQAQQFERSVVNAEGMKRETIFRYVPDFQEGRVAGFYVMMFDVTEHREIELCLQEERERGRVTLNAIADGVITTDCAGVVTYLNPKAEQMTGWKTEEASGNPIMEVLTTISSMLPYEAADPVQQAFEAAADEPFTSTCTVVDKAGRQYQVEQSASRILDVTGNVVGTVIVLHDVSEERAMASRIAHFAHHDALTNLPNRVLLIERLDQAMNAAGFFGGSFALVFLDVDHFKNINDSVGHAVGDGLLRAVAERLSQSVKACDTVCRMGGDEFILLLSGIESGDQAAFLVQQILRSLTAPHQVLMPDNSEYKLSITASAGVAMFPDDGADRDTLMRRADVAMYLAKQAGRNRYQFFSADLDQEVLIRHSLLQDMREAIDKGEFRVFYQPKVSTKDRSVVGVEALVRWQKANGELVSPGEFIPLAEKSGLMVDIGAQVLVESCRQYARWQEIGLAPVPVSVNVSAVQLGSPGFLQVVASAIEQTGILPEHLELEITESTLMGDVDKAALLLYQLKELGVKVSLDDFGTGYSSLSYLRRFPLDCIKIDRSFVSDLTTNSSTAAIMKTICNLGRTLNLKIVAEGVETEAQAQLISNLQCDAMQGFLFSKPVRAELMTRMLPYNPDSIAKAA
jgi:diguanylate cyclase (GGDEF)-like protein/PAS domain S-box-containing protein